MTLELAAVAIDRPTHDSVHITLSGEIDLANAQAVQDRILGELHNQVSEVRIDLSALTYMDSAGLRLLFTLATRLRTQRTTLHLLAPPGAPARKLIALSGLEKVTSLHPAAD